MMLKNILMLFNLIFIILCSGSDDQKLFVPKDTTKKVITFQPNEITGLWIAKSGEITFVSDNSVASNRGVQVGWKMQTINGKKWFEMDFRKMEWKNMKNQIREIVFDTNFVLPKCNICYGNYPVMIYTCQSEHMVCFRCFVRLVKEGKPCPFCRNDTLMLYTSQMGVKNVGKINIDQNHMENALNFFQHLCKSKAKLLDTSVMEAEIYAIKTDTDFGETTIEMKKDLLEWVFTFGSVKVLETWLQYFAEKDAHVNFNFKFELCDKMTPLIMSSIKGNLEIMEFLLKRWVDVNKVNTFGETALYVSAKNGNLKALELLFQNGANLHKQNFKGNSPLYISARKGHFEAVKFLLENGANVNERNLKGKTPWDAATANKHSEIIKILKENGASNSLDNNNE